MPIGQDIFIRAQGYDRAAVEALLEAVYPTIHRMAHGLSGREDVARGILRFVINRAMLLLPQWRDPDEAVRWFYHHTVLTARRAAGYAPKADEDLLMRHAENADAPYAAFMRALRALPVQQREAFILHHGEHFSIRNLGVAMDCSTRAAELHLQAGSDALASLAGPDFDSMRERMADAYARLAAADDLIRPDVRRHIFRALWPRRVKRWARRLAILIIIAAATWLFWRYRHLIPWPGE